jgi:hypothetical protein
VRCRNLRCRSKLPIPTDNEHHAFCSKYCFEQFFQWRCKVCEKPILKGRRRKVPDYCHDHRCRKEFRRYPDAYSYSGRNFNQDAKSAHFMGVKIALDDDRKVYFGTSPMPDWHWDDSIVSGEDWLYAYGRVVAIICGAEGGWKIRYPIAIPVQTAPTLEAARKLVVNVSFWMWSIGGIKPKPEPREKITEAEWRERDLADEKYVAEDEARQSPADADWIDWPRADDEGAA